MTKSLIERHPELANPESLAIFKRKWEYLFFYAEVGYARAYTHYTHFTFVRPVCRFPSQIFPTESNLISGEPCRTMRLGGCGS